MNIKRIIFWWIAIVLFLWWFLVTNTFAQSTNPLCSTTLRNELARTDQDTYKILYNITDPLLIKYIDKNYANFNLNKTISWEPLWHDNKKWWCNNLGLFVNGSYNLEVQNWNTFRNKYWSIVWIVNWNELSQSTVTNMQNYIKDHCGFNMWVDGKLGKKTINSINICLPPAWWKLLRNEFKSLAEAQTLFVDAQWKTPIYNGTTFDTNFKPDDIYVDTSKAPWITTETKAIEKWLKIIQKDSITTKDISTSCAYENNNITQSDLASYITNYKEAKLKQITCKQQCNAGDREKTITINNQSISVCEECDIEKCNCGIKLNTKIPFIGRCIVNENTNDTWQKWEWTVVNTLDAFPKLMWALIKLLMSLIMIVCFASLIIWWFMMTIPDQYDVGKWLIKKVVWTIVILGSLWTILYLINPNFFS
jgi:hypothetical protein